MLPSFNRLIDDFKHYSDFGLFKPPVNPRQAQAVADSLHYVGSVLDFAPMSGSLRKRCCYSPATNTQQSARRRTLPNPTQDEMMIYEVARQLLAAEKITGKRIRLIGVGGSNLMLPEIQADLFDGGDEKRARLLKAVDELRSKLGSGAIKRGTTLK